MFIAYTNAEIFTWKHTIIQNIYICLHWHIHKIDIKKTEAASAPQAVLYTRRSAASSSQVLGARRCATSTPEPRGDTRGFWREWESSVGPRVIVPQACRPRYGCTTRCVCNHAKWRMTWADTYLWNTSKRTWLPTHAGMVRIDLPTPPRLSTILNTHYGTFS